MTRSNPINGNPCTDCPGELEPSPTTRSMLLDEVWHVIEAQRDHLVDLEARVKALEDYLDHDVIDEVAPLPREDLD